jgi:hypothetical protein
MQVGWLAIQVIARAIQHLEVTLLEVTTLSFVICAIGTFAAWYRKPYDVQTYILLETEIAVEDVDLRFTDKDGNQRDLLQNYRAAHHSSNVVDDQGKHVPPYSKLAMIDDGLPTYTSAFTDLYGDYWGRKPYDPDRIRNDRLPVMEKHVTVICALTTAAYAGLHISAWNVPLATHIEQLLWRISALAMMGCVVAWFSMDHFEEYLAYRHAKREGTNKRYNMVWWRVPASIVVALVYGFSRGYILIESFLALRRMPASAYQQVNWGRWVPHI